MRIWPLFVLTPLAVVSLAASSAAQETEGPYRDAVAERLHVAAIANRELVDESVVEYTAVVQQRVGASLRTPLKDRTLYRLESSHRVFWKREGETLVQVLALREQTPVGVEEGESYHGMFDEPFDPVNDRLLFGFANQDNYVGEEDGDDFWFEHPLYPEYRDSYDFTSGDTLTLSLPDGRSIQAIELQVVPTVADVHRMTGSLWIEPESGALVRAVYRLSEKFDAFRDIPDLKEEEEEDLKFIPGLFKPWTAEISLIAVDYALWDFDVWLPRSMRAEGVISAGILKAPATVDVSYRMESVITEADLAQNDGFDEPLEEVHFKTRSEAFAYLAELMGAESVPFELDQGWSSNNGRRTRYLVPQDLTYLAESPDLPPPVWEEAPGFTSQAELENLFDGLADLPTAPVQGMPYTFRWGLQRPDLARYNRIEGLSVGARGQIRPQTFLGALSVTATTRLGAADLVPNIRLDVTRETIKRKFTVSGFHELTALEEGARHLGLGNSLLAATVGRDDGDYYRRSGAWLEWTPPTAQRQSTTLRAFAEYHGAVSTETDFAVFHLGSDSFAFRDNLTADEGWLFGGALTMSPWWGSDPNLAQGGISFVVEGATGDYEYGRSSLEARLAVPLPSDLRFGLEAGVGTSWGAPPAQKLWYVGGPGTLRGYDPRRLGGESFGRARGELARTFSFGAVSLFSDYGWAGVRDAFELDDGLYSAGVGLSILDGLIRMDSAWGLKRPRGFRFDFYLDAIL